MKIAGKFKDAQEEVLEDLANPEEPTTEELKYTYVAPGRKALLPLGIVYQGPWKLYADGLGRHCREQVKALVMSGLPIRLQMMGVQPFLNEELHQDVLDVAYLEKVSLSSTAVCIKQLIFHNLQHLRETICPGQLREAYKTIANHTVLYTSWERDRVFPEYIEEMRDIAQLWVPCERNKQAFEFAGFPSEKIKVIPYPYDPAKCVIAAPRGREEVPDGRRFYHIGKWEPRKNQHQLLGAFLLAFTPKDKVSLFIKTSEFNVSGNYPNPEESANFWLNDLEVMSRGWTKELFDRRIRIISQKVSEEDIVEIHRRNNIYISSALGEAWDIPAFDAKLAGNRLVFVGFGGPEDYAEDEDVQVPSGRAAVHPSYGWEKDAQWAEVQTSDFAAALARATPPEARVTPSSYYRRFSHHAVGDKMQEALMELVTPEKALQLLKMGGFG